MKLATYALLSGFAIVPVLAITEAESWAMLITAVLGSGGLLGFGRLIVSALRDAQAGADARLEAALQAAREERTVLTQRDDVYREKADARQEKLLEEIRGLRGDLRSGSGCRATG